jgi:cytochrome b561
MFFKILLIILNGILLSAYCMNVKLLNTMDYHSDGLVFFFYILLYDLMLLILVIGGILNERPLNYLVHITFILQNLFALDLSPREVPVYGMYLNIFIYFLQKRECT